MAASALEFCEYVNSTPPKLENAPSIPPYPPKLAGYHQPSPLQAAILEQDLNALVEGSKLPFRLRGFYGDFFKGGQTHPGGEDWLHGGLASPSDHLERKPPPTES